MLNITIFFAAVTLILLGVTVRIVWRLFDLGVIPTKKQPEKEFWNMPIEPLIQVIKPEVVKIRGDRVSYVTEETMRNNYLAVDMGAMRPKIFPESRMDELIRRDMAFLIAEKLFELDAVEIIEHEDEFSPIRTKSFQIEVVRPVDSGALKVHELDRIWAI